MQVIRRNGAVSKFDASKISVAMTKALLAVGGHTAAASRRVHEVVEQLTAEVVGALSRRMSEGRTFHIEDVQDQVELALMRSEHHKVARAYVLYREERTRQRAEAAAAKPVAPSNEPVIHVTLPSGVKTQLDSARLSLIISEACAGLDGVDAAPVIAETHRNIYDGISQDELALASVMAARTLVEQEPNYAYVSARLLLDKLRTEVLSHLARISHSPACSDPIASRERACGDGRLVWTLGSVAWLAKNESGVRLARLACARRRAKCCRCRRAIADDVGGRGWLNRYLLRR